MQHLGNNNLHVEQNQLHTLNFFPSISLVSRWWYFFTYWDSLSTRLTGIKQNGLELHEKANRKADSKDFIPIKSRLNPPYISSQRKTFCRHYLSLSIICKPVYSPKMLYHLGIYPSKILMLNELS